MTFRNKLMMRNLTVSIVALIFSLLMTSCHAMTQTVAERCVLIDLQGKEGRQLIPLLDAFAKEHGLVPEKSHPVNPRYEKRANAKLVGEVSYSIGMGRFGAELSVFRYDRTRDADLLAAFDVFVDQTVAPKYKVTRCIDMPDYQLPEVYR